MANMAYQLVSLTFLVMAALISAQDLPSFPEGISISPATNNISVKLNATATFKCTASNWNMAGLLYWRRRSSSSGSWVEISSHGVVVSSFQDRYSVELTSKLSPPSLTSTLTIKNAEFDDAGSYRCEAAINGATKASSWFTFTVIEAGTGEVLPIPSLRLNYHQRGNKGMSNYKTSAQLVWPYPTGKKNDESWTYTLHLQYVYNRKLVTKDYKVGKGLNYKVQNLEPCTDYKAWVTGYSQRCRHSSSRSHYYRSYPRCSNLVPGVYRRATSRPSFTFMTLASEPLTVPQMEDIEYSARSVSKDNCTIIVTYKHQHEPFGCPTQGFSLNVSTPETWPRPRVHKSTGPTTTLTGLRGDAIYPAAINLYNKYGEGPRGETFFLECHKVLSRVTEYGDA